MAGKQTGMGHSLLLNGINVSGDVTALDEITGSLGELDCTGIDKSARERIGGIRDGLIKATSWWNNAVGGTHDTLAALPTADVHAMYLAGSAIGDWAACLVSQQATYAPSRDDEGSMTAGFELAGRGYGLEWGQLLTAGLRADTTATNGGSLDYGATIATTAFGLQAYLQITEFTGTNITIKLQESSDNAAGDAFADVTGGSFGAQTAVGASRIATSASQNVERYLRVVTSGTFTSCTFAVTVAKNLTATSF